MKNSRKVVSIFFLLFCCVSIFRSKDPPENVDAETNGNGNTFSDANLQAGKALAAKHCRSCHMLPDPSLLDKENWQTALAMMAPRLGIYDHYGKRYPIFTDIDQSFYPHEPAMSSAEWQNIIDYYTGTAPAVMYSQHRAKPIKSGLPFFSIQFPPPLFFRQGNTASFITIDTFVKPHRIIVNRTISNTLFMLGDRMQVLDSISTNGTVVNINLNESEWEACTIGTDLYGNNSKEGSLIPLSIRNSRIQSKAKPVFDGLARPVQISPADINLDGRKDYLICEFGNLNGSLLWMENLGQGKYKRHDIRQLPGATKAYMQDFNQDGLPDICALFAQGEEGIFLFTNKGNGSFSEKQLLRFPPSYGSTFFELVDFNHDGFSDIVYTCGDRGDGIRQLKPYHGVYVFLNNGKNDFLIKYFFPVNGCIKAMARDFDRDGDLDMAVIGFFTDNQQPEEGFIFLENKGNLEFDTYSLPRETNFKKIVTMDVADLDGDGKLDIILGHGFIGNKAMDIKRPLFIVLKNRF